MRRAMAVPDPSEIERFRREDRRIGRIVWYSMIAVCVASGLVIGELWSYAVGFVVACVLALGGFGLHLRLHKARWRKRFPEVREEDVRWRRTSYR